MLLLQIGEGFGGRDGLQFWQVYFITTPHRWITLALVFLDRERFGQRRFAFLSIAAAVIIVCFGVRLTTGALTCLLTIDYIWNAWHFASQHHGIYRIYENRNGVGSRLRQQPTHRDSALPQSTPDPLCYTTPVDPAAASRAIEKWSMRLFLLYVILRVAGATWSYTWLEQSLRYADWAVLIIPAWLVVRELLSPQRTLPRLIYLGSVMALYISLLFAVHANQPALILSLATASAVFHATEYLALVAWAVHGRHSAHPNQLGIMSYLAPRWGLALGVFILVLGAGGWLLQKHLLQSWLLVNVIVAFLHYAYDGLIWRHRA